jgi:hypothetical protein
MGELVFEAVGEGVVVGGIVSVGGTGVDVTVAVPVGEGVMVIVCVAVGKGVGSAIFPQNTAPTPLNPIKAITAARIITPPMVKPNRVKGRKPKIIKVTAPKIEASARWTAKTTSPSGQRWGIPLNNPMPATARGRKIS